MCHKKQVNRVNVKVDARVDYLITSTAEEQLSLKIIKPR